MLRRVSSFLSAVDSLIFKTGVSMVSTISFVVKRYEEAEVRSLPLCKRITLVLTDPTSIVSLKLKVIIPLSILMENVFTRGLLESAVYN